MSTALAVYHGCFGRVTVYRLDRPLAPHAHHEGHLIFHIGGQDSGVVVAGRKGTVTRMRACAVNPWQVHSFHPGDPVNGSLYLVLYINPIWFVELGGRDASLSFGCDHVKVTCEISDMVSVVAGSLLEGTGMARLDQLLFSLTRDCYDQTWRTSTVGRTVCGEWPRVRDFRIRNSLRILRERVGDQIVLDSVARESGLSRPHFYKLFRQNVGLTPNIYLNTLKMELSIEKLTTSELPVTEIGLDLGFSSQASFTRFFAANAGIPPTIYRKASQLGA